MLASFFNVESLVVGLNASYTSPVKLKGEEQQHGTGMSVQLGKSYRSHQTYSKNNNLLIFLSKC